MILLTVADSQQDPDFLPGGRPAVPPTAELSPHAVGAAGDLAAGGVGGGLLHRAVWGRMQHAVVHADGDGS